mmetsp:Transcript_6960/g.21657  ORF Transcript_6960/g.21657 Transcript_6960/m.21657 type:complete len:213 (+) Transcript_6960:471-1109(+)
MFSFTSFGKRGLISSGTMLLMLKINASNNAMIMYGLNCNANNPTATNAIAEGCSYAHPKAPVTKVPALSGCDTTPYAIKIAPSGKTIFFPICSIAFGMIIKDANAITAVNSGFSDANRNASTSETSDIKDGPIDSIFSSPPLASSLALANSGNPKQYSAPPLLPPTLVSKREILLCAFETSSSSSFLITPVSSSSFPVSFLPSYLSRVVVFR